MTRLSWVAGAAVVGSLALAGCGGSSVANHSDPVSEVFQRQAQEEQLTRVETDGKRLFGQYCATCHGDAGEGDGQNAFNLDPEPPNLREALSNHDAAYWRQIVEGGSAAVGRSPLCPPWGLTLSTADIDTLIAYLQVLARPASPAPGGSHTPTGGTPR